MQALRVAVAEQTLLAHLAAQAAVLHPGEVGVLVGQLEGVDVDGAGLDPPREALGAGEVLGVHGGGEAGVVQVRAGEDVLLVAPFEDRDDGAFYLVWSAM